MNIDIEEVVEPFFVEPSPTLMEADVVEEEEAVAEDDLPTTELNELPDSLILNILTYSSPFDIGRFSQCSKRMNCISQDELLWKRKFHQHFCLQPIFPNPIGSNTWKDEFVRLIDEVPAVEAQVILQHTDQVLHVSHSHNGQIFATTSKDAYVHIWKSAHPVELRDSADMKEFSWKYTQFSQFNEADTLLLVSGVLFGNQSTSGEIAVFKVTDELFELQCRIKNKPYDIFGSWYSDNYLFSGDLHWLGHLVSKSVIWLNKASQEVESEHTAVMNQKYQFYNPKASSVRSILVANCVDCNTPSPLLVDNDEEIQPSSSSRYVNIQSSSSGNPPSTSHNKLHHYNLPSEADLININSRGFKGTLQGAFQNWKPLNNIADINYTSEFHLVNQQQKDSSNSNEPSTSNMLSGNENISGSSPKRFKNEEEDDDENVMENDVQVEPDDNRSSSESDNDEMEEDKDNPSSSKVKEDLGGWSTPIGIETEPIIDPRDKWLIFTHGTKTYTPHMIGFKRIKPFKFKSLISPGLSLRERHLELKRRRDLHESGQQAEPRIDYTNYNQVADLFDSIDHVIELHGHVIGMTLSPCHKYLYVNSRPWPANYTISDPLEPPPIAQEIDIHVIDLTTLRQVGMMRRAHRAYTPNEECFFIFLDASTNYLASGAEDKHCYLWERNYGISLAKFPHDDVVNSVAFNPRDQDMLISVSDDEKIKIWRSLKQCRQFGISTKNTQGLKLYLTPRPTYGK